MCTGDPFVIKFGRERVAKRERERERSSKERLRIESRSIRKVPGRRLLLEVKSPVGSLPRRGVLQEGRGLV